VSKTNDMQASSSEDTTLKTWWFVKLKLLFALKSRIQRLTIVLHWAGKRHIGLEGKPKAPEDSYVDGYNGVF